MGSSKGKFSCESKWIIDKTFFCTMRNYISGLFRVSVFCCFFRRFIRKNMGHQLYAKHSRLYDYGNMGSSYTDITFWPKVPSRVIVVKSTHKKRELQLSNEEHLGCLGCWVLYYSVVTLETRITHLGRIPIITRSYNGKSILSCWIGIHWWFTWIYFNLASLKSETNQS